MIRTADGMVLVRKDARDRRREVCDELAKSWTEQSKPRTYVRRSEREQQDQETPSAVWHPQSEAQAFVALVRHGHVTTEQAEHDIRMSDDDLHELAEKSLLNRDTLGQMQRLRERTWRCFQRLCRNAGIECPS